MATPAMPARPEPMKNVGGSTRPVCRPLTAARSRFCMTARIRRPCGAGPWTSQTIADHHDDEADDEQPGVGIVTPNISTLPLSHVGVVTSTVLGAEEVLGDLLQDQSDAEGHEQRVERAVVHPPQQQPLHQHADQPGRHERHREATTM